MLEDALELVRQRRLAAALSLAVEAWSQKPHAGLAALVSALGELCEAPRGKVPPTAALLAEPQPIWLDELLSWVASSRNSPAMTRNLQALVEAWPEDPRIIDWIISFLGRPAWDLSGGNPRDLAEVMVQILAASRDERVEAFARELPAFFEAHKGSRKGELSRDEIACLDELFSGAGLLPGYGRQPPQRASTLSAEELAMVEALRAELRTIEAKGEHGGAAKEQLLKAVIDGWGSDDAKQVYADFLLEQGDPQGELIALELHGDAGDKGTQRRVAALRREVAASIGVPASGWEKGFPREVRVWGAEGPTSRYGEELAWGTVAEVDVPPTSDACHTENLRVLQVAVSYLKDLQKLREPLPVEHLVVLNASKRARPALKKISALPKLKSLELCQPTTSDDYGWIFAIPWLAMLETLTFRSLPIGETGQLAHDAVAYFAQAPALCSVELHPRRDSGPTVMLRRDDAGEVAAVLEARNDAEVEELLEAFIVAPRPCFAVVELHIPDDEIPGGLEDLAQELRLVRVEGSPAKVEVDEDIVVVGAGVGAMTLDVEALRRALEGKQGEHHRARISDINLLRLSRYLDVCKELGFEELWLRGRTHNRSESYAFYRGRDGWLEVSLPTYSLPMHILERYPELPLRLRCSPNVSTERIEERFTGRDMTVEVLQDPEVLLRRFRTKVVKSRRRLEFDSAYGALSMPAPEHVELLRARYVESLTPKVQAKLRIDELRVCVQEVTFEGSLAAWLDWAEAQSYPVTFKSSANELSRMEVGAEGLEVSLYLPHLGAYPAWGEILQGVGDQRIAKLAVRYHHELDPTLRTELERSAVSFELVGG